MTHSAAKVPTTARKEAAMVIAMLLVLAIGQAVASYRTALRHAEEMVSALAKSLDYQIDSSFRSIDSLLAEASDRIDLTDWPDPDLEQWFRIRLADFPEIRYLTVTGPDGRSIGPAVNRQGEVGGGKPFSVTDLEHYRYHVAHPEDHGMHVGNPIVGRRDGFPLVPLSRALRSHDGKYTGYVMASLDPQYLLGILKNILIEDAGAAAIIRSDGIFLARAPWQDEAFGKSMAPSELYSKYLVRQRVGVAHFKAVQDGNQKISGFRALDRYPVSVFVGVTTRTDFAEWRFQLYCLIGVVAVCSAALLRGAARLDRREYTRRLLARRTSELKELSIRDDLTGLLNQRAFHQVLRQELAMAEQYRRPLVLVYFDLNDFKRLNDREGHKVGDQLLGQVAAAMRQSMRDSDHCCRYGGDEFAVIMPNTVANQALTACRRLIGAFDALSPHGVSFSIGVAQTGPERVADLNYFVRAADALMYEAKNRSKQLPGHHMVSRAAPLDEHAAQASSLGAPSSAEMASPEHTG